MKKLWAWVMAATMFAALAVPGYARESYFYQGDSGYSTTFNLIGGKYTIYVHAHFVRNFKTHSPDSCVFMGNLQRIWPTHDTAQLGGPVPLRNPIPFKLGPSPVTLAAGRYTLYIASMSDCEWEFLLESAPENTTGVSEPQMFMSGSTGLRVSATASVHDAVQFTAQYRTSGDAAVPVSGEVRVLHNGKTVRTLPVKFGIDKNMQSSIAYAPVQWTPEDAKYAGKNTAKMILKIDGKEYIAGTDFTLTP